MKVILTKDVARLGRRGEVKDVPDGHAINFLIPRKMAIIATALSLKKHVADSKQQDEHAEARVKEFKEILTKLGTKSVVISIDANEKGHLFKGINVSDIAKQFEIDGIKITKESIELPHPIKELGTFTIALQYGGVSGECTLEIVRK